MRRYIATLKQTVRIGAEVEQDEHFMKNIGALPHRQFAKEFKAEVRRRVMRERMMS